MRGSNWPQSALNNSITYKFIPLSTDRSSLRSWKKNKSDASNQSHRACTRKRRSWRWEPIATSSQANQPGFIFCETGPQVVPRFLRFQIVQNNELSSNSQPLAPISRELQLHHRQYGRVQTPDRPAYGDAAAALQPHSNGSSAETPSSK